jgi:hypothetical protein
LEGSDRGLTEIPSQHLPGGTEDNNGKYPSREPVSRARSETSTFRMYVKSVTDELPRSMRGYRGRREHTPDASTRNRKLVGCRHTSHCSQTLNMWANYSSPRTRTVTTGTKLTYTVRCPCAQFIKHYAKNTYGGVEVQLQHSSPRQ